MPRAACGQKFKEGPNRRSADPPADHPADPTADPSADPPADVSADPPADPTADPTADQESGKYRQKIKFTEAKACIALASSQLMGCSFCAVTFCLYSSPLIRRRRPGCYC